jgi:hypothetical protein
MQRSGNFARSFTSSTYQSLRIEEERPLIGQPVVLMRRNVLSDTRDALGDVPRHPHQTSLLPRLNTGNL